MLNDSQPQVFGPESSKLLVKKVKDPKDMTAADHLQAEIEAQNEKNKEK
jgi:hypothetical protein